jgi:hypothetical protein
MAVDRTHRPAFRILVRLSSDSRYAAERLEHLTSVPTTDTCTAAKLEVYSITSSARAKSDLAPSLNNLAGVYQKQGRLAAILQKPFS